MSQYVNVRNRQPLMPLFFSKSDRVRLLGFNDLCFSLLGIFPVAGLGHLLFGGANVELSLGENLICYGIALAFTVTYWVSSRYTVLFFRNRYPGEEQTVKRILLMLPVLMLMVTLISVVGSRLLLLVENRELIPEPSMFFKIIMSYTLVILMLAIYEGIFFFTKYRQSSIERERLAKENTQSQLSVLKQQMNPHFLFNSLNTLVNIIPEDSRTATLFTQRLSAVYRRILEWRHKELIPLHEEVSALQDYVFLMQTRFEDKLSVCWHWQDGAGPQVQCEGQERGTVTLPNAIRSRQIVPLSLQILVENAIKHNVVSSEKPLRIDITLSGERITVANPLHLRTGRQLNSTGWGHQNLRARYGMITEEEVVIQPTAEAYTVTLPLLAEQAFARTAVRATA